MAQRFDVQRRVVQGNRSMVIGTDRDWRLGPFEGSWWVRYSWWVIPLGLLLIIVPWLILGGVFGQTRNVQPASVAVAQPVPVVIQVQQTPPPTVPPPTPTPVSVLTEGSMWDDPRNR